MAHLCLSSVHTALLSSKDLMLIKSTHRLAIAIAVLLISGCSYIESTENEAAVALSQDSSTSDAAIVENRDCLTFGYRNWQLQRDEDTVTLSGEASMPTPAWSIVLHQNTEANSDAGELIMETIEPQGFSNSVVSWVAFETTITASKTANITVKCADDVVWNSQES